MPYVFGYQELTTRQIFVLLNYLTITSASVIILFSVAIMLLAEGMTAISRIEVNV